MANKRGESGDHSELVWKEWGKTPIITESPGHWGSSISSQYASIHIPDGYITLCCLGWSIVSFALLNEL